MKFITRRAEAADHAATEAALIDSLNASYARLGEMTKDRDHWKAAATTHRATGTPS